MEIMIKEMKSSWTHCKELIRSDASLDLVVAFLEDFKDQFTQFYSKIKESLRGNYRHAAVKLVDKAFLFWKQEGELSQLISLVKKNWSKKDILLKQFSFIDTIISSILHQYAHTTRS